MIGRVLIGLPVAACSAAPPEAPVDPCAAVKQRYAAHRERIAPKLREIDAREKADVAAGKGPLERSAKFGQFMTELEGEEKRYQIGMQECGGISPHQKGNTINEVQRQCC